MRHESFRQASFLFYFITLLLISNFVHASYIYLCTYGMVDIQDGELVSGQFKMQVVLFDVIDVIGMVHCDVVRMTLL